jgi:hypothetical protein
VPETGCAIYIPQIELILIVVAKAVDEIVQSMLIFTHLYQSYVHWEVGSTVNLRPWKILATTPLRHCSIMSIFLIEIEIEIEIEIDKGSSTLLEIEIEIDKGCSTVSISITISVNSVVDYRD